MSIFPIVPFNKRPDRDAYRFRRVIFHLLNLDQKLTEEQLSVIDMIIADASA